MLAYRIANYLGSGAHSDEAPHDMLYFVGKVSADVER
ncbi:hypothetical protein C8P68_101240 [Mucilaginibacter yixingensis]|uniref:Uncharacterized protein n=1 Tax=Mucilaginibacter yixingensis TaxID=1295612 RepID=A0A2T5JEZ1_9SPHI|nr:hypothetical protein C8P68_101240 [Mucilaginibacter yixingensis]